MGGRLAEVDNEEENAYFASHLAGVESRTLKVALSFPINKFINSSFFKELAYVCYDKCFNGGICVGF